MGARKMSCVINPLIDLVFSCQGKSDFSCRVECPHEAQGSTMLLWGKLLLKD